MMPRRKFLVGSSCVVGVVGTGGKVFAQDPMSIPYLNNIRPLPGEFADCNKIRQMIAQAEGLRGELAQAAVVDGIIQSKVDIKAHLEAEIKEVEGVLDNLDNETMVQKVGIFLGLAFLAAGLVVEAPVALAALFGLEVISSTGVFMLQAVYTKAQAPSLVAGYTKDKVLIFGEPLADQAGSTGGKVVAKALSIIDLAVSLYSLHISNVKSDELRFRLRGMVRDAKELQGYFDRYKPNVRAPWRAMFDTNLQGTIAQLQQIIDRHGDTNCMIMPTTGPVIVHP